MPKQITVVTEYVREEISGDGYLAITRVSRAEIFPPTESKPDTALNLAYAIGYASCDFGNCDDGADPMFPDHLFTLSRFITEEFPSDTFDGGKVTITKNHKGFEWVGGTATFTFTKISGGLPTFSF